MRRPPRRGPPPAPPSRPADATPQGPRAGQPPRCHGHPHPEPARPAQIWPGRPRPLESHAPPAAGRAAAPASSSHTRSTPPSPPHAAAPAALSRARASSSSPGTRGSKQSYCRFLPEDSFLDLFELGEESEIQGSILKLPFPTIFEYLHLLQLVSTSMNCLGHHGMFYLAAAVSDFYVPWDSMTKHKIDAAGGPLNLQLSQVRKMLFILRNHWAPSAFCVSFKLETDPDILLPKAEMALRKYGMNVMVANELANYKDVVVKVTSSGKTTGSRRSKADDLEE
ncbi:phosphopantothenate--cysteine ligase 2-like [Lolium rigidum]|uniref:phosphopantothenate--cysteine ligase 2-like n=1 Tax=Lolium rigidum TaxID=89674 RepID=UPI001F5CBFBB|nr:phosphopantothenate--cysteine ligase 2-like [Lolium rigidum]